jgi:hypothetical protein
VDRLTEALEEAASSPVQAQHEEEASGPELDSEKWKPALRIMLKQKDDAMGLILPRPSREHQRPVVLATSARIWQPQAETIDNFDQCIARHCVVFCFGCGDQWRKPMCDYSLHVVASRPARVGETLVTTSFYGTSTRGFAAKEDPGVAVCLLSGTELAFEHDVRYNRNWLSTKRAGFRVARFCTIEPRAASASRCHRVSERKHGSREFIVGRAVCTGTSIACYPAGTEHQSRC